MEGSLTGYLGLGSNVGDREANLRRALAPLEGQGIEVLAASSIYETAPQGEVTDQPDFLNAVLRVATELGPEELLDACKRVERELGREAGGPRHGPRTIDVSLWTATTRAVTASFVTDGASLMAQPTRLSLPVRFA